MPTKPVVRASSASHGRFHGLTVDPLEDTTVPPSPVAPPVTTFADKESVFSFTARLLLDVFNKNKSDFDRAQALYNVFIELASAIETTSQFSAVMTRIAENLATLGCTAKPCHIVNPVPLNTHNPALSNTRNHAHSLMRNPVPFRIFSSLQNLAPFRTQNHVKFCTSTLAPFHMRNLAPSRTLNLANYRMRNHVHSIISRSNPSQ
ncbi:hypothetical protein JOM56_006912 [Amanita muscaria]